MSDELKNPTIRDRVKVNKDKADETVEHLNNLIGVSARQVTTDEFDIPPTAVISVEVNLLMLTESNHE